MFTQFILSRFGDNEPTRAQRQNSRGFAHKRLGLFLNLVDGVIAGELDAGGDRPDDPVEADQAVDALLRPRARSPGMTLSQRRAIEQRAVDVVTQLLTAEGWNVRDVGATHSYDLHCSNAEKQELYVEVKGTTGALASIPLTANEVALARTLHPATALFVVHGIHLEGPSEGPAASRGEVFAARPWRPNEERLRPTAYSYRIA